MTTDARWLVFHSAVVLLAGLMVGAPYGRAVKRGAPEHVLHAWRLAHGTLPLGAALGFGIAAILSSLSVGSGMKTAIAWIWIVSNYSFMFSLPLGAIVGQRGITPAPPLSNRLVYLGNMSGIVLSLAGAVVVVYAAYASL